MKKINFVFGLLIVVLSLSLAACGIGAQPAATETPLPATETPLPPPSATPEPTATETPAPTPTATVNAMATRSAQATQQAEDALAEKMVVVKQVFEDYELPEQPGKLGEFFPDALPLTSSEYGTIIYEHLSQEKYGDFAFYTDVEWESTSGLAGCGIAFHSDKNFEKGEHYRIFFLRLSGAPAWDVEYYKDGRFQFNAFGKVLFNSAINLDNGGKNSYFVVMRDKLLTVYANNVKMRTVDITKGSGDGYFVAFASQESGKTTCTFSNGWIWDYSE